jgi:hypothetical protein
MSQSDAQFVGHSSRALPRGWVIVGLGAAAWLGLIGMAALISGAFQMIVSTIS